MTAHHRLFATDRLRCACGWSVPWPPLGRWGEIWDAHIKAVESALTPGAPAGAVTPWPLPDVLRRLAAFARHCLDDHCCDQQGYEGVGDAIAAALRYAGVVTMGSPVVPPAPMAKKRHTKTTRKHGASWVPACSCGWRSEGTTNYPIAARMQWLEHAVAAYQQEEAAEQERSRANHDALLAINSTFVYDDDEADCDALAGDDVAGSEVRQ